MAPRRFRDLVAAALARLLPAGVMRDKRYFDLWQRRGWHALPVHFDSPIPDTRTLDETLWQRRSDLPGVNLDLPAQLARLETLARWAPECERFPRDPDPAVPGYYRAQRWLPYLDAAVLHATIRGERPRRIVEVGGGFSTLVAAAALALNRAEGRPGELTTIDPYPSDLLQAAASGATRLMAKPVQAVPLETFTALEAGDILFIDSSHVVRIGGDVVHLWLEVVPRLAPGVLVHAHDIFLPAEYHRAWVMEERLFWSEQYLVQAFLAFNRSFEVVWAAAAMHAAHPEAIRRVFPSHDPALGLPGSLWLRRVD